MFLSDKTLGTSAINFESSGNTTDARAPLGTNIILTITFEPTGNKYQCSKLARMTTK